MSEWQGLVQNFLWTLTLREFWVLLYAENLAEGGEGVSHPPPAGISDSTYAMKLKLTPGNGP